MFYVIVIFFSRHELIRLVGGLQPDLHHPAVAVGVGIDELGLVCEPVIDLDDLSRSLVRKARKPP